MGKLWGRIGEREYGESMKMKQEKYGQKYLGKYGKGKALSPYHFRNYIHRFCKEIMPLPNATMIDYVSLNRKKNVSKKTSFLRESNPPTPKVTYFMDNSNALIFNEKN